MEDHGLTPQHASVSFAERRADVLSELVRIFTLSKEPLELVEAAVNLVASAIGEMSVFVYFWDPESERLILRTMTHADQGYSASGIEMRLGEGITGWSALHRKPVLINEGFEKDPRFLEIDDVDESQYASVLTAPIYDHEALYGVFAMYSAEAHAFGEEELAIAEEVGLLLASALKRAQTVRELELQSATARFLIDLPPLSGVSFAAAARECTQRILTLLEADACIIDYVGWLSMSTEPVAIAERLGDSETPKVWLTRSKHQARDIEKRYESNGFDRISASLGYGISHGVLTCFRSRRFTKEESSRLSMLAAQVGVLIENIGVAPNRAAQMMALLASDREDQMLESLRYLGWKGNGFVPVLVQVKRIGADVETFGRIASETVLSELGPETLLAQSGTLILLLVQVDPSTSEPGVNEKIRQWLSRLEQTIGMSADIGIGQSTTRSNSIRNSFIQARAALAWASFSSTRKAPRVMEYDAIRAVRDLPRLVFDLSAGVQRYCETLGPLQQYDLQHGTQLVETIESFALHGGSVANAAESLFIHRNTLRQRLSRVATLVDEDFWQESRWPEVLLATRLLRQDAN